MRKILLGLGCWILIQFSLVAQKTEIRYLSGIDKDNTVTWDFLTTGGRNSGKWSTIEVPGHWELQGFGTYNYGRPYEGQSDEKGMYKHTFTIPSDWKGKRVNIVFEGSMTDTEVKINGKSAGPIHQGAFYEFSYNISNLLKYGAENLLEVTVAKKSANESVNEAERYADFWIFGGIFRPVYLEAKPKENITRFAVNAQADGALWAEVFLDNIRSANLLEGQLYSMQNEPLGKPFSTNLKKGQESAAISSMLDMVKPWTPETPNLYKLEIRLKKNEELIHRIEDRIGFRTVELREGDGIYVNGTKVFFKGVNRHSSYPTSGRTTSKALSIMDVNLMKDMNLNSVRMSHYPPDKHFLYVCDSLGLFVLDELTGWQQAYDTTVAKKLVKELVIRDVNHPSIVIWDNGNEGGHNRAVVEDYGLYDPQQRPVIHPWEIFNGTDTQHYKSYNCCIGTLNNGSDVFFPTEFLHGLFDGGHGAGLEDYDRQMRENPLSAGGFLWVFADEGIVRTDKNDSLDVQGSQAPDGIVGPYREKEGSYYAIKEIWSPVRIAIKNLPKSFNGKLPVENRYLYTNLKDCSFSWELADWKKPNDNSAGHIPKKSGKPASPSIAPGESGYLSMQLPEGWNNHDVLYLKAEDPDGREIYTWSWALKTPAEVMEKIVEEGNATDAVSITENGNSIILTNGKTEINLDKTSGLIAGVKVNGQNVSFSNGPKPAIGEAELTSVEIADGEEGKKVEFLYTGEVDAVSYAMLPGGWLEIKYRYLPKGGLYDFMGFNFSYPEEKVNGMKWLGKGPFRVWKNRMKGVEYNVWEKDYNNTITGESGWEYPEFKGYHSDFYWVRMDTDEQPIFIATPDRNMFLRVYTPQEPKGAYNDNTEPPFPDGDISVLHAIPAIGTKFKNPTELGPMGQKNVHQTNRKNAPNGIPGTIYLKFGE